MSLPSCKPMDNQLTQAQQLAKLLIAKRCQRDLYYLTKHILGYTLMTEATHKELCQYTSSLLPYGRGILDDGVGVDNSLGELETAPHSIRKDTDGRILRGNAVNHLPSAPTQNFQGEIGVHTTQEAPSTESSLYQAGISGTPNELGVHSGQAQKISERTYDSFDDKKNQLLLLMPRGTFKSSVVTIGFSLQMILNDPDVRILIDSETFQKAKAFLAEIKGHLEGNDKFREIYYTLYGSYPDAKKRDNLWSDSQLNISARKRHRKEPTLSCGGVDVTKNGMHYDLIIMDDLHSELNTANEDQIDKVIQHYKLAFSLLDPGKPLIVIGTRWDYSDVYQHILDNEAQNFNIMVRKAYNPDGSLFFPERLTEDFLKKTRETQGSYLFSCQYMNEPVDNESATFKRSHMVRIDWELVKDMPINWYLAVDPSYEGPYSDYAALVVAGMDHQRQLYVRHILRAKMTYGDIITNIFDLYNRFEPRTIALETIAAQKSIQYELANEQKRRGVWLPLKEIRSRTKSKEERIRGLAPYYEFGRIFHIANCPQLSELEDELIHFPKFTHDDVLDALATILEVASPTGSTPKAMKREKNRELYDILTKPRSPLTGV